ncbi:MAG: polysaccharide biosynthesis/export family protein [Candidatus Korobacteraceae bacterium]
MKTITKGIGLMLLLALNSVALRAQQDPSVPFWGSVPAVPSAAPAIPPSSSQVQMQPNASSPAATTPAPGSRAGSINPNLNSMITTATGGPVNLGAGDLLDISVFDSPELTTHVRVSGDGEVTFPLLGQLLVGGMTPQQVQDLIRERLVSGDLVKDPQVAVFVSEYASQTVFVLGEVNHPGAYPLMGSHHLFDFVSAAGGFTPRAGKTIVVTRHADPLAPETVRFSRDPDFAGGNPAIDAGDTVYVKPAGVVYVVGDVIKPGGFLMDSDDDVTVLQALATAAGTKPTAALGSVRLLRKTPQGRTEITVNINQIVRAEGPDPALHDQDILYVPRSAAKVGVQSFMTYGMAAAVGAIIYRF